MRALPLVAFLALAAAALADDFKPVPALQVVPLPNAEAFDHPDNPGHPSPFHVRNDGWMGISLSLTGPVAVQPNQPLRLRYGLWMHDGMPGNDTLEPVWRHFSEHHATVGVPAS